MAGNIRSCRRKNANRGINFVPRIGLHPVLNDLDHDRVLHPLKGTLHTTYVHQN